MGAEKKAKKEESAKKKEEERLEKERKKEVERRAKEVEKKAKELEKEKEKKLKEEERDKKKAEKELELKAKEEEKAKKEEEKAKKEEEKEKEVKAEVEKNTGFFGILHKGKNMRLAPLIRGDPEKAKSNIDSLEMPSGPEGLYLHLLQTKRHKPLNQGRTWPYAKKGEHLDDED